MMRFLLAVVLLPMWAFQCHDKESFVPEGSQSFIFGYFNDFCMGPTCTQLFLLKNDAVFADSMDRMTENPVFLSTPLSGDKAVQAQALRDQFPQELMDQPDVKLGCPGCVDQGSLYLAIYEDNTWLRWELDPDTSALPVSLRAYATLVRQTVEDMKL